MFPVFPQIHALILSSGAPEPAVATKKTKVAPATEDEPKLKSALKRTASRTIVKDAPEPAAEKPARKLRKRAEDLIEPEQPQAEPVIEKAPAKAKKTKTTTTAKPVKAAAVEVDEAEKKKDNEEKETEKKDTKKSKAGKSSKAAKETAIDKVLLEASDNEDEDEPTIDDQTAALLAGFDSSEDENDPQDDGIALDKLPALPDNAQLQKQIKEAHKDDESTPGVLYVGYVIVKPKLLKSSKLTALQSHPSRFLRTPDEGILFTIRRNHTPSSIPKQAHRPLKALRLYRIRFRRRR